MWDWLTGYNFQQLQTAPQPGSIDSETGIFALTFDQSGSRLMTCEADKTIKIYKEDENAVIFQKISISFLLTKKLNKIYFLDRRKQSGQLEARFTQKETFLKLFYFFRTV